MLTPEAQERAGERVSGLLEDLLLASGSAGRNCGKRSPAGTLAAQRAGNHRIIALLKPSALKILDRNIRFNDDRRERRAEQFGTIMRVPEIQKAVLVIEHLTSLGKLAAAFLGKRLTNPQSSDHKRAE